MKIKVFGLEVCVGFSSNADLPQGRTILFILFYECPQLIIYFDAI